MPERLRLLLWPLLLAVCLAHAGAAPPAEFWDYLEEFGDTQDELFDPLDLGDAEAAARSTHNHSAIDPQHRITTPVTGSTLTAPSGAASTVEKSP